MPSRARPKPSWAPRKAKRVVGAESSEPRGYAPARRAGPRDTTVATGHHGHSGGKLMPEANRVVQVDRCSTRRARTVHTTPARARTSPRSTCRLALPASLCGPSSRGSHTSSGTAGSQKGSPRTARGVRGRDRSRTGRSTSSKTIGEPAYWIICSKTQFPRHDRERFDVPIHGKAEPQLD